MVWMSNDIVPMGHVPQLIDARFDKRDYFNANYYRKGTSYMASKNIVRLCW